MVTLRLACSGPGRVWVTDQTGHEILGTSGCQLGVVFGSGWRTTARDGRRIHVGVSPSASWVAELWLGTPPGPPPKTA